jgi:hypothetical protein
MNNQKLSFPFDSHKRTSDGTPDINHIHQLIDQLASGQFFGLLSVRFTNGKPTSVKKEESLELPSFAIRKAAEHAGENNNGKW